MNRTELLEILTVEVAESLGGKNLEEYPSELTEEIAEAGELCRPDLEAIAMGIVNKLRELKLLDLSKMV